MTVRIIQDYMVKIGAIYGLDLEELVKRMQEKICGAENTKEKSGRRWTNDKLRKVSEGDY